MSYREKALDFWPEKCRKCGSEHALEVHHIDRDHGNTSVLNLAVLCRDCHRDGHRRDGRRKSYLNPNRYKPIESESGSRMTLFNPVKGGKKRVDAQGRLFLGREFAGEVVSYGIEETELKTGGI